MPRLTAISNRITNAGAKKTPVFIKIYSGTDFTSFHSTWTFSTGTISLRSNTLPYHSYGNPSEINTATNQNCNKTWPLRAGLNTGSNTVTTTASVNIGYWINGVNILNPSADTEAPNGYLTFDNLHYNASYTAAKYYSYSLEHDKAGGRVISSGNYHYQDYSFATAWTTAFGHETGSAVSTGTAEVSLIPYLGGSLTHPDGHSKILGWSLDGYPIYGPYGYNQPFDNNSGVRPMTSGYTTINKPADNELRVIEGALSTFEYPIGIFVEDYYFAGTGDLDISNGRYCVTPEYPLGTYAYFCSVDPNTLAPTYPYVIGNVYKSNPVGPGQTTSNTTNGGGSAPKQTG